MIVGEFTTKCLQGWAVGVILEWTRHREKICLKKIQRTYSDHTLSFPDCIQLHAGWGCFSQSQFVTIRQVQPSGYNYRCKKHRRHLPSRQDVSTGSGHDNISQNSTSFDLGTRLGYFTATLLCRRVGGGGGGGGWWLGAGGVGVGGGWDGCGVGLWFLHGLSLSRHMSCMRKELTELFHNIDLAKLHSDIWNPKQFLSHIHSCHGQIYSCNN